MSAFALEDDVVYHTYSAYARGTDGLWGMFQWLDRAPRRTQRNGCPRRRPRRRAAPVSSACDTSGVGPSEYRPARDALGRTGAGHIRRYRDCRIANTPKATNPSATAVSRNLPNGCVRIVCIAPSNPGVFCRSKVSVA